MESRISKGSEKVATFDLDHTLLKPKGKYTFSKDRDDAQLVYPQVATKLKQLKKDGYKIVIFTNQKRLGKQITVEDIYYKIDKYLPNGKTIDVYISYKDDQYRKPLPGMFDKFMENNGPITDIFYVGDAAGRKGDFSCSDAKFAHNCGIQFYIPEHYFLNKTAELSSVPLLKPLKAVPLKCGIPAQTVVVLVGPPGCGKSTLANTLAQRHVGTVIINNDTAGSANKSLTLYKKHLGTCSRIIVDNTNATILNRAVYTEVAKDKEYKVYALTFDIERDIAVNLNYYRSYYQDKPLIPMVAYASFYKRFEPVKKSEMYDQSWTFVPNYPEEIFEYSF